MTIQCPIGPLLKSKLGGLRDSCPSGWNNKASVGVGKATHCNLTGVATELFLTEDKVKPGDCSGDSGMQRVGQCYLAPLPAGASGAKISPQPHKTLYGHRQRASPHSSMDYYRIGRGATRTSPSLPGSGDTSPELKKGFPWGQLFVPDVLVSGGRGKLANHLPPDGIAFEAPQRPQRAAGTCMTTLQPSLLTKPLSPEPERLDVGLGPSSLFLLPGSPPVLPCLLQTSKPLPPFRILALQSPPHNPHHPRPTASSVSPGTGGSWGTECVRSRILGAEMGVRSRRQ